MSGVPYTFGNATTTIALSNLDTNFATPVTIGNTSVGLGNTVTTIGNLTLTNTTITGLSASALPTGSVIQVVQGTLSSAFSSNSTSYVSTGLTASITPLFSTSKILIIYNGSVAANPTLGLGSYTTIYRNSTNLEITSTRGFNECNYAVGVNYNGTVSMGSYLDSPATTSSTTYTVYMRTGNTQTVLFAVDGSTATITLMEIR